MGEGGLINRPKDKVRIAQYYRYDNKHSVGFSRWTEGVVSLAWWYKGGGWVLKTENVFILQKRGEGSIFYRAN